MSTVALNAAEIKGLKITNLSNLPTIDDLTESFSLMDDWEMRYALLIELGKNLPDFPEDGKCEANIIKGCVSQVWMIPEIKDGIFTFTADSDAHIVKGLIAVLFIIFNNKPVIEIKNIDVDKIFVELGLDKNISPNRRNGFFAMVKRIQSFSKSI